MLRPSLHRAHPTALALLLTCSVIAGSPAASGAVIPDPAATPPQEESDPSREILERGEAVYVDQCVSCHGEEGNGDGAAARFLESQPRDFTAGEWKFATEGTVEALTEVVRDGIDDTAMTPFSDMLTDEEIVAVVTYVLEELAKKPDDGRIF